MPPDPTEKFFFLHIMKTGGTSFTRVLEDNFPAEHRYPVASPGKHFFEHMERYINVAAFVRNVNADRETLRVICGHVPLATRDFLLESYRTLTLLRDPVERIVSYLKHSRRYHIEHKPLSLEAIYEDEWFRASFMSNYQTKIYSMTPQETIAETRLPHSFPPMPPRSEIDIDKGFTQELQAYSQQAPGRFCMEMFAASTGVITVDDQRLEAAKRALDSIDVVGVTNEFDRFLATLADTFNWTIREFPKQHVGERDRIDPAFRQRIEKDNAYDCELFEYASSLARG
jgi:hypothetical protein